MDIKIHLFITGKKRPKGNVQADVFKRNNIFILECKVFQILDFDAQGEDAEIQIGKGNLIGQPFVNFGVEKIFEGVIGAGQQ